MAAASTGEFGTLLRRLRLAAGLTQEALAERAHVSAKAVGELERNSIRVPRLDTVALLADALGLNAEGRAQMLAAARPDQLSQFQPSASDRASGNLPRPLTSLFGRTDVIDAVAERLRRCYCPDGARLLVLTGPGGVGKSRLAIAAAERAAEGFPAGVVFVDLAPLRDPNLVLAAIAQRLAVDERGKIPLEARLTTALRGKRLLLVLDNFEHLLPAHVDVLTILHACPQLAILATSRVALRVRGEREYRIVPLEVPGAAVSAEDLAGSPAVALFLDRAGAVGADLDPIRTAPVVAEICRRLDGLPLAIELAAAWTRLLSPPALLARLERRLPLLVGGPHDLPARQRTMRDTIAWSYDLLRAREQRLFRQLCVFVGGYTPEAAAAVCANPAADADPALLSDLASLVDRGLLCPEEHQLDDRIDPRLTMLETLREFGLERLAAHQEIDELRLRHVAYYVSLAESAETALTGPSMAAWHARLACDHDNMRVALALLVERGDAARALRLAGALWHFWAARGYLGEGRQWLQSALALPAEATADHSAARVKALAGAAYLAVEHGHLDEADVLSAEAVDLARELADHRLMVTTLNTHGVLAWQRGAFEQATRRHDEALALASASGNRAGVAAALTGMANIAARTGNLNRADELFRQSLDEYRAIDNIRGIGETLKSLCFKSMYAGVFDEAERLGTDALRYLRMEGDTGAIAEALWALGVVADSQGHDDRAVLLHEESLALRRDRGDERGAAKSLTALGAVALRRSELRKARTLLSEALAPLRQHGDCHGQALVLTFLGHVALSEGDSAEAHACLIESAGLFQEIGNPLYLPWCLEGLAGLAAEQGNWERAAGLHGARHCLRAALGSELPAANPASYASTLARSREALGGDAFARACESGDARPLAETLAEAGIMVAGEHQ
jgi:predicted ATPase/transcriptional regulator with XRE-family HTH domain